VNIDEIILLALHEDIGSGDHTSLATIPVSAQRKARLLVKEVGIIAGNEIARKVFHYVDSTLLIDVFIEDGAAVHPGDVVFEVSGSSISILTAERTVLNFMQRMSGIATQTKAIVNEIADLPTKVLDTRKTTPLLREIEKMAVRIGGGTNHRFGLFDMILIKDNHVDYAGGIRHALESTKKYLKENDLELRIEIEVRNLKELKEAIDCGGLDRIMLDNFEMSDLRHAVQLIGGRFETEASGGITLKSVREYAECGVDFVSIGYLTHHINSLDLSLKAVRIE
jgi:nicotinate-nucleotide pyrophosphorylase (carboxylating)